MKINSLTKKLSLATTLGFVGFNTYVLRGFAECDTTTLATGTAGEALSGGVNCSGDEGAKGLFDSDGGLFKKIVNVLLFLIGSVSVIMLIVGGFRYVVSAGDSGKVTEAKNTIMYAIIGIVVAFLAWGMVSFVVSSLAPAV
jgi:hypothetical protein